MSLAEVDGLEDNLSVQPMSLEPPAAPGHVLSTDQRYTDELHTTDPAGYAHSHRPPTTGELKCSILSNLDYAHEPQRTHLASVLDLCLAQHGKGAFT